MEKPNRSDYQHYADFRLAWRRWWRDKNKDRINREWAERYKKHGRKDRPPRDPSWVRKARIPNVLLGKKQRMGRKFELIALSLLEGSIDKNRPTQSFYDIEWRGNKIEVKSRSFRKKGWTFSLSAKQIVCDYYFCFCVKEEEIKHSFLIPKNMVTTRGIYIPENGGKWLQYKIVLI